MLSIKVTGRQRTDGYKFIGMDVGEYGISSNYFQTLCEMLTDLSPSVWLSVIWWHFK
jgi:hypothetical protein